MKMTKRKKMGPFERLIYGWKGLEALIVEALATVGPWLAPLTPAYLTFKHTMLILQFPPFFAWATAIAVEITGLASGHTMAKFYMHNKGERAKKNKLPILPIAIVFVFYLLTLGILNLSPDWYETSIQHKVFRTALILLSVPAITIVSVRAQHAKVLMDKEGSWVSQDLPQPAPAPAPVQRDNGQPNSQEVQTTVAKWLEKEGATPVDVGRGGISPKYISDTLNLNYDSVRSAIFRLQKEYQNA
jgi:hypothetical protein